MIGTARLGIIGICYRRLLYIDQNALIGIGPKCENRD